MTWREHYAQNSDIDDVKDLISESELILMDGEDGLDISPTSLFVAKCHYEGLLGSLPWQILEWIRVCYGINLEVVEVEIEKLM